MEERDAYQKESDRIVADLSGTKVEPNITPEVITLQDATDLLVRVNNRKVYMNTSVYETQYALILALESLVRRVDNLAKGINI